MTLIDLLRRKGLDALDEVISPGSTPKPSTEDAWRNTTPRNHRVYSMMMDAEAAVIIHRMRPIFAAFNQPRPRTAKGLQTSRKDWASEHKNPLNVVSDITSPVFSKADNKDTDLQAREQVTAAGAAALAEKARTGAFPDALPGAFTDPFTGKPLGYRREGDGGFVVYSVGPDGKFDGGKPGEYKFTPPQAFFRYPGPSLQPVPTDMLK